MTATVAEEVKELLARIEELQTKARRVATPEGAAHFRKPIGTVLGSEGAPDAISRSVETAHGSHRVVANVHTLTVMHPPANSSNRLRLRQQQRDSAIVTPHSDMKSVDNHIDAYMAEGDYDITSVDHVIPGKGTFTVHNDGTIEHAVHGHIGRIGDGRNGGITAFTPGSRKSLGESDSLRDALVALHKAAAPSSERHGEHVGTYEIGGHKYSVRAKPGDAYSVHHVSKTGKRTEVGTIHMDPDQPIMSIPSVGKPLTHPTFEHALQRLSVSRGAKFAKQGITDTPEAPKAPVVEAEARHTIRKDGVAKITTAKVKVGDNILVHSGGYIVDKPEPVARQSRLYGRPHTIAANGTVSDEGNVTKWRKVTKVEKGTRGTKLTFDDGRKITFSGNHSHPIDLTGKLTTNVMGEERKPGETYDEYRARKAKGAAIHEGKPKDSRSRAQLERDARAAGIGTPAQISGMSDDDIRGMVPPTPAKKAPAKKPETALTPWERGEDVPYRRARNVTQTPRKAPKKA
jgi:hypothetical protein